MGLAFTLDRRIDVVRSGLSNFVRADVPFRMVNGGYVVAPTLEHAFQAAKARTYQEQIGVLGAPTAAEAKRLGRLVACDVKRWEQRRVPVMLSLLRMKFFVNRDQRDILLSAKDDAVFVERNTWHDQFWGECGCVSCRSRGVGKNILGNLLHIVRRDVLFMQANVRGVKAP